MIVNTRNLQNVALLENVLSGTAGEDEGLLQEQELVVMANGVHSFLNFVETTFPRPAQSGDSSSSNNGSSFNAFSNYEEAMNVFRTDARSIVKYKAGEILPTDEFEGGNDVEYDVTGDFIDVGRYLEGIPESMGSMRNGRLRTRRVRILADIGYSAMMEYNQIIRRSERIIRLVDALEKANIRTEITSIYSGQSAHGEVIVKQFNENLSLEDLAIATHPEFFRRMVFRVIEHSPTWQPGYGSSVWLGDHVTDLRSAINDEITIYLHCNMFESDEPFDDLEKKIEVELSQSQPVNNLFYVDHYGVKSYEIR